MILHIQITVYITKIDRENIKYIQIQSIYLVQNVKILPLQSNLKTFIIQVANIELKGS